MALRRQRGGADNDRFTSILQVGMTVFSVGGLLCIILAMAGVL